MWIILICVVILIWLLYVPNLSGFWVASRDFCNDAKIDTFIILLNKKNLWDYAAYLLMVQEGETCINDACTAKIYGGLSTTLEFSDLEVDEFPTKFTIDVSNGRMRLYRGDTLYGIFYKDTESSNMLTL